MKATNFLRIASKWCPVALSFKCRCVHQDYRWHGRTAILVCHQWGYAKWLVQNARLSHHDICLVYVRHCSPSLACRLYAPGTLFLILTKQCNCVCSLTTRCLATRNYIVMAHSHFCLSQAVCWSVSCRHALGSSMYSISLAFISACAV